MFIKSISVALVAMAAASWGALLPAVQAEDVQHAQKQSQRNAATRVQPGLVRWHASPEHAQAAAKISGKPVLVFQMLGRLDKLFC